MSRASQAMWPLLYVALVVLLCVVFVHATRERHRAEEKTQQERLEQVWPVMTKTLRELNP